METNLGSALFTASISVVIGGGVSYLLYVKTIGKWYAKDRSESKHAKIKYWCGILSLLTITQGVMTIANELINSLVNNVVINVDNLAKGVVVLIIFPTLLAVITYTLIFFIEEKSNKEKVEEEEASKTKIKKENKNTNNLNLIIFLALAVVVLLVTQVAPYLKTSAKEKTFLVKSCMTCNDQACVTTNKVSSFKVSPPFILIHGDLNKEIRQFREIPVDANENCEIHIENNFAFNCERIEIISPTEKNESFTKFDGKNTYQEIKKITFEKKTLTTKSICQTN